MEASQEPIDWSGRRQVPCLTARAEAKLDNVSAELSDYIFSADGFGNLDRGERPDLAAAYRQLGVEVFDSVVHPMNRLIDYLRCDGQFWLESLPSNPENMRGLWGSCLVTDGSRSAQWNPYPVISLTVAILDENRFATADRWASARAFAESNGRVSKVSGILAAAELLHGYDYDRSAIVEAVAALELALSNFAAKPILEGLIPAAVDRVSGATLRETVQGIGLRGSMRFLIPVLFPESELSTDCLARCLDAVQLRNEIVHNGRTSLPADRVSRSISGIREACKVLGNHTANTPSI